jgi:tRNA-modifying protein YgfZ
MTQSSQKTESLFFDLSERAKFRFTGADRLRFLNGQLTNDLRKASETAAIEACVLNAKGRMDAHIFVSASGECFLADAEAELREALKARLERYVIADDVQIEDVTGHFSLFHMMSEQSPPREYGRVVSVRRFAQPGLDIWSNPTHHDAVIQQLSSEFTLCDADTAEVMRIEQGIPRWGRELTDEIIPVEANLEQRTIDYQKGCYIGQEVISRMKMSGQTNKRLCGLISLDDVPLQRGMKLAAPSVAGKEVGWITSVARSQQIGKEIALGYVKRGFNSVRARLDAFAGGDPVAKSSGAIPVEVVPLPFV